LSYAVEDCIFLLLRVKSGNEPLVPISTIIPTSKLLEEIWSKAMIAKKAE